MDFGTHAIFMSKNQLYFFKYITVRLKIIIHYNWIIYQENNKYNFNTYCLQLYSLHIGTMIIITLQKLVRNYK